MPILLSERSLKLVESFPQALEHVNNGLFERVVLNTKHLLGFPAIEDI